MSFGQKPSAWTRPQGGQPQQINPNLFTNQLGLTATGQAFSTIPGMPLNSGFAGLVNQAAFTNTMNMSMLAQAQRTQQMIPTQQVQQQRHPQQQQATSPTRSQRTFIGVVTKLMETYGFVDEDVFFQTNVIRGSMPRAGDRVMVEASYNPSMPFKWNASRIQLIQDATQNQSSVRQPQQQNGTNGGGSRWGERIVRDEQRRYPAVSSRRSPTSKRPSSRQHSPPLRSSPRKRDMSPKKERDLPTKRERREELADRERDRGDSSIRGHSAKRDTDSPPRRRQRVIPRYFCNLPKQLPPSGEVKYADLRRRYTNLYIPSDFIQVDFDWVQSIHLEQPINFSPHPIQFNVLHKDIDIPLADGEQLAPDNPIDADYRYVVKVLLISHPGLSVIRQKVGGLSADGSIDESQETQPLTKNIHILVGHKSKGEYMCIGGPWSSSLDGQNPMAPQTLIRTAIRTTKALTGLDLSNCSKWYKMVHLRYFRVERQRIDSVVLMLPDTSTITEYKVTDESYRAAEQILRDQLTAKLSAIEAEVFIPPGQNVQTEGNSKNSIDSMVLNSAENDGTPVNAGIGDNDVLNKNQQAGEDQMEPTMSENVDIATKNVSSNVPEAMDTSGEQQSEAIAQPNESLLSNQSTKKESKTPWVKLEPNIRAMKVAELREELELRGLDSKGVKNILMQRLMDAIEKEKAIDKENEANQIQQQTEASGGEELTQSNQTEQQGGGEQGGQEGNKQKEISEQTNENDGQKTTKEKESIMVKIKEEIVELMETDEASEEKKETPEEKEAREKAEKEQRELEKAKEKFEKDKKERMASLERHYGQIQKEPGIFVYPSKTAKSGKFDLKVVSLHSLLDYRLEDSKEASFEVFVLAEAIKEALDRSNGFMVYHAISTALDREAEKKKLNEALAEACKDEDVVIVDEGGKKDTNKDKDDKGNEKQPKSPTNTIDLRTNFKALVNNFEVFTAFVNFDANACGYITDRDLEEIIHSIGLDLSRAEVQRLIKKISSKERVNYRNLTDKWVDKEGDCKYSPKPTYENLIHSYAEHAKGHLHLLCSKEREMDNNSEGQKEQTDIDESGIVFYKGALVNLKHCLEQQMFMAQERQNVLDVNSQLEMQLKTTKEQYGQLEKKKRRLDDDVDRYRKKLHDTEKTLRKEQEENSTAKKALQDCKRYGDRIIGIVGNVLPSSKPKEAEKEKEKNATKEKETVDGIVLIDETVAVPEKEEGNEETINENIEQEQPKSQGETDANNAENSVNDKQNDQVTEGQT